MPSIWKQIMMQVEHVNFAEAVTGSQDQKPFPGAVKHLLLTTCTRGHSSLNQLQNVANKKGTKSYTTVNQR